MKFIITIQASITKAKHPKLVPVQYKLTEAFNQAQAERRASSINKMYTSVEPLDEWIAKIDTI